MTVKSAQRALEILEYVAQNQPVPPSEIWKHFNLPKSSAHALTRTLVSAEFLSRGTDGHLSIGIRAFMVGSALGGSEDWLVPARDEALHLAAELDQTANVAVLSGSFVTYLVKEEPTSPIRLVSNVGQQLPAHATALGKALLAELDNAEVINRVGSGVLPVLTDNTVSSAPELLRELATVRQNGWAHEIGQSTPGVECFASVVRGGSGKPLGALSVSVIALGGLPDTAKRYSDAVLDATSRVEARLKRETNQSLKREQPAEGK